MRQSSNYKGLNDIEGFEKLFYIGLGGLRQKTGKSPVVGLILEIRRYSSSGGRAVARYSVGATPLESLKTRLKDARLLNPTSKAIWVT